VNENERARSGRRAALALTWFRLALAPALVWIGLARGAGWLAAAALAAGFLSDVFDGVIARHYGASTSDLRRLDSTVDTIFYLAAAYCAWRLYPGALRPYLVLIAILLGTEVLTYVTSVVRLGREASYHARSARVFGLLLFVALCTLLGGGSAVFLPVAIAAGFLSHAENLAITFVLPEWRHDVPSVIDAWRIRESARQATERRAA
jgi:CDP-diacylglycerol--glycerol-3-phosphate 3-phosphatidyltransferase